LSFLENQKLVRMITCLFTLMSLVQCGDNGKTISGKASASPIVGATVNVYCKDDQGNLGELIGTSTTDKQGFYEISVPSDNGCLKYVSVTGGTYLDKATGAEIQNNELKAVCTKESKVKVHCSITRATTMAASLCDKLIKRKPKASSAVPLCKAANIAIAEAAGVKNIPAPTPDPSLPSPPPIPDITEIIPVNPNEPLTMAADSPEVHAEVFDNLVDQIALNIQNSAPADQVGNATPDAVLGALSDSFGQTGSLDGKDAQGNSITIAGVPDALPQNNTDWQTVQTDYINNPENTTFGSDNTTTINVAPDISVPATPENPAVTTVPSNNGNSPVYCSCSIPSLNQCTDFTGSFYSTSCGADQQSSCLALAPDAAFNVSQACPTQLDTPGGSASLGGTCSISGTLESFEYFYTSDADALASASSTCTSQNGGTFK